MIRKIISIIIYIFAGIFFSATDSILFVAGHQPIPLSVKLVIGGFLLIMGLILFFIGALFSGLRYWLRDLGILLIVVAVLQAFTVMVFFCMYLTPDIQSIMPKDMYLYQYSQNALFLGVGYIILMGAVGAL